MNKSPNDKITPKSPEPAAITSTQLFGGRRELRIVHNDEQYLLRITANNKLILTK